MNISGNTILITGGASDIGFELAAELLKLGNTVITTGRDQRRLERTQRSGRSEKKRIWLAGCALTG